MTKAELKGLLALWDNGPNTAGKLGVTPFILKRLIGLGFCKTREKAALTYVGKTFTIYSLSERGRRECVLTGKRFVVSVGG